MTRILPRVEIKLRSRGAELRGEGDKMRLATLGTCRMSGYMRTAESGEYGL
jgi:hypothetical protein